MESPNRATLTNSNLKFSFSELRKRTEVSLRPTFKNLNFESKDELKNTISQMSSTVENKDNLHKVKLVTFQP